MVDGGSDSATPAAASVQLRFVGFCGADDSVEPAQLKEISEKHGWVEWGVLFRDEKAGTPRYASAKWLAELGRVNAARQMRLAGHLCANKVDELLSGDTTFSEDYDARRSRPARHRLRRRGLPYAEPHSRPIPRSPHDTLACTPFAPLYRLVRCQRPQRMQ